MCHSYILPIFIPIQPQRAGAVGHVADQDGCECGARHLVVIRRPVNVLAQARPIKGDCVHRRAVAVDPSDVARRILLVVVIVDIADVHPIVGDVGNGALGPGYVYLVGADDDRIVDEFVYAEFQIRRLRVRRCRHLPAVSEQAEPAILLPSRLAAVVRRGEHGRRRNGQARGQQGEPEAPLGGGARGRPPYVMAPTEARAQPFQWQPPVRNNEAI